MRTAADVFGKMKDWSKKTLNARHRIFFNDIAAELSLSQESLLKYLTELENAGLIKIHWTDVVAISLTRQGVLQEKYSSPEEKPSSAEGPLAGESDM